MLATLQDVIGQLRGGREISEAASGWRSTTTPILKLAATADPSGAGEGWSRLKIHCEEEVQDPGATIIERTNSDYMGRIAHATPRKLDSKTDKCGNADSAQKGKGIQ